MDAKSIIDLVAGTGVFAVLFVWLLLYVMKQNDKREMEMRAVLKQSQDALDKASEKILTTVCDSNLIARTVSSDLDVIGEKVHSINVSVDKIQTDIKDIKEDVETIAIQMDSIQKKVN